MDDAGDGWKIFVKNRCFLGQLDGLKEDHFRCIIASDGDDL